MIFYAKSLLLFVILGLFNVGPATTPPDSDGYKVISERKELNAIVPKSFYFAGLSGGTQMRNSSVGVFAKNRYIVAGLVDVSGYSTDISGVYEGFFITDSPVKFGDKELPIGQYGIGFAKAGKANVFDISSKKILEVSTTKDTEMRRPRPLMMTLDKKGIRLYKGRDYVLVRPK